MKKLFILSLCFMFFVQNVEASVDLFCGHCCEHKNKCLAEKSAVKDKAEQHKFWRNTWFITTVVAGFATVVFGYNLYRRNQELTSAKSDILSLGNQIDAQEVALNIYRHGVDGLAAVFHHI
jgi:hypothetical protein